MLLLLTVPLLTVPLLLLLLVLPVLFAIAVSPAAACCGCFPVCFLSTCSSRAPSPPDPTGTTGTTESPSGVGAGLNVQY